jgi:hypothetical protein
MLDPDDERVIKDAKDGRAVLVTWDRVLRLAAGGMTPYEALDLAKTAGTGPPKAQAEVSQLRKLSPADLTALAETANKTYEHFRQYIPVTRKVAKFVRYLRVEKDLSWRSIARYYSFVWEGPWGGNQLAGMIICEKAAKLLGENYLEPPWN